MESASCPSVALGLCGPLKGCLVPRGARLPLRYNRLILPKTSVVGRAAWGFAQAIKGLSLSTRVPSGVGGVACGSGGDGGLWNRD